MSKLTSQEVSPPVKQTKIEGVLEGGLGQHGFAQEFVLMKKLMQSFQNKL